MNEPQVIWIIRADSDRYTTFRRKIYQEEEWLYLLDLFKSGEQMSKNWQPLELIVYKKEEIEGDQPIPDLTMGMITEAISSKARSVLEPLIENQVEFLPLITPYGYYYEMNIKRVDCLDIPHSKYELLGDEKKLMWVDEFAFNWEKLKGIDLFLLPELGISKLFCSDTFKRVVEESGLTGFLFDQVPMAL